MDATKESSVMLSRHLLLCVPRVSHFCRCRCHSVPDKAVRVRFAPSPTGQLHLGGLRTALYNYLYARANGGKFILRIEDTDQSRYVPGAMEKLIESLTWAKIQIDEGPTVGGKYGPYIQSERIQIYKDMSERLLDNETAYHCFCTPRRLDLLRKEALQQREIPKYDNRCRHLTEKEVKEKLSKKMPYTVRFKLEHHTEPWSDVVFGSIVSDVADIEGDPILMKTDGYPTYHFANVVDDHLMEISHVLRGSEWQASTTKHVLLYKAFDWTPPQFAHLPLLLNKDGKKLSKRQGDVHVEHFKEQGYFPETILNLLTDAGSGFKVKVTAGMDMDELIQNFDLTLMSTHSTRVDFEKLRDLNRLHLGHRLADSCEREQLLEQLVTLVREKYQLEENSLVLSKDYINNILDVSRNRIHQLEDLLSTDQMYLWLAPTQEQLLSQLRGDTLHYAEAVLESLVELLKGDACSDSEKLKMNLKNLSKERGLKFGQTMKVFRAALSGLKEGPSIAEMISTMGKEASTLRLQFAVNCLHGHEST